MVKTQIKKNELNNKAGITLIALVVTIVVLLILAGVSIVTLAGNNGLLNRTTSAKEKTEQAGIIENIRLAYQNALIGQYTNDGISIANQIKEDLEKIYVGSTIEVNKEDDTYTVTIPDGTYTIDANGNVARLESLNISPTPLNLQIREGETPTETTITATKYGIEGTVSWSIAPEGVANLIEETGDEIHVKPVAGGSATLTATCGEKTKECTVTVTEVNKVAVTFNLGGGSVNSSTDAVVIREFPGETITLPTPTAPSTTPTYTLKGWYDAASDGNKVYAANLTTTTVPNSATTVYAQWKEPKVAFRSYGEARNTGTYGSAYSLTSTGETIKVDINNTPNNATDDVTVADDWKIFYEDDDFIYLIYGDYYPVEAQTTSGTSNLTFAASTSKYPYEVYPKSKSYKAILLAYLRNNSGYSWSSSDNSFASTGTDYLSWSKLKAAISGLSKMSGKTITVQGAPDIDLWVESWNAKYSSSVKLKALKGSNGYNIMLDTESSNSNYQINVTNDPYNGANDEGNGKGYYDEMYFPYRSYTEGDGTSGNAFGYWLASPGDKDSYSMCSVSCWGELVCQSYYYNYNGKTVRPVVAIEK